MADPRDQKSSVEWMIRTESGKMLGPYLTATVLKMIGDGTFTGTEQIRKHPEGKWIAISRQSDFYDKLLETLEPTVVRKKREPPPAPEPPPDRHSEETVIRPLPPAVTHQAPPDPAEDFETGFPQTTENDYNPNSVAAYLPPPPLQTGGPEIGKPKEASLFFPMLLIFIALGLGAASYFWPSAEDVAEAEGKPNLLAPRQSGGSSMTGDQVRLGIRKAVTEYLKDTFEGYLDSENTLVSVVEGAPQNVEARGMLCLVYKELWPFVRQDSKDLDAINFMAKSTRSLDPIGINGVYCEVVKLMTQGKYKEARGIVEYALNTPSMATAPVLYSLKSELMYEDRDTKTAILYAEKASQLWPEWIKPIFDVGRFQAKLELNTEAMKSLQKVLERNSQHKLAQIQYGILLFKAFHQTDDALRVLQLALSSTGRLSRVEESQANFFIALIYSGRKESGKAVTYAKRAYALNPGDPAIKDLVLKLGGNTDLSAQAAKNNELVYLGDQHLRTGNCLAAQAEYKAAFDLDPTNGLAAMKAAKCLWQLSQGAEAINWLNKAIVADPKLTSAYVMLADFHSRRYNYLEAAQALNKGTRLFPNNYELLRGYGLVELRRNNAKDALGFLQRSYKIYENDQETLILLAKAYSATGDFNSAQKYAVRAIEIDSTNKEAQILYAQVISQFQGLEAGLVYIRDLVSRFSYTVDFRLALAQLNREHERFVPAQKIYEQIVDADPKNKEAHLGLGLCLQGQALFDKALKEYLMAASLDPSDAEPLFRAGLLYLDIGKYSLAVTQFRRAQTVNGLYPRLNFYIGKAYFQNGEYQLAIDASLAERKVNPNIADSYVLAAEVYAATKQVQKSAAEYQQAVKLRPQGADLYVKMGRCYRQSGSPDIAESMLNIAASKESGFPEIYKEQGAIYETRGDARAAVQAYNKYLALSPNAPDRKQIESLILSIGSGK